MQPVKAGPPQSITSLCKSAVGARWARCGHGVGTMSARRGHGDNMSLPALIRSTYAAGRGIGETIGSTWLFCTIRWRRWRVLAPEELWGCVSLQGTMIVLACD